MTWMVLCLGLFPAYNLCFCDEPHRVTLSELSQEFGGPSNGCARLLSVWKYSCMSGVRESVEVPATPIRQLPSTAHHKPACASERLLYPGRIDRTSSGWSVISSWCQIPHGFYYKILYKVTSHFCWSRERTGCCTFLVFVTCTFFLHHLRIIELQTTRCLKSTWQIFVPYIRGHFHNSRLVQQITRLSYGICHNDIDTVRFKPLTVLWSWYGATVRAIPTCFAESWESEHV
jgi:hypothetical protein